MSYVRVRLDQLNSSDPSPMIINICLGKDKKPSKEIPYSGWWGIPKGNHWCRPLIFKPNGKVDFGGNPEDSAKERYATMSLFDRPFEIGSRFYLEDAEDNSVFEFVVRELIDINE